MIERDEKKEKFRTWFAINLERLQRLPYTDIPTMDYHYRDGGETSARARAFEMCTLIDPYYILLCYVYRIYLMPNGTLRTST